MFIVTHFHYFLQKVLKETKEYGEDLCNLVQTLDKLVAMPLSSHYFFCLLNCTLCAFGMAAWFFRMNSLNTSLLLTSLSFAFQVKTIHVTTF